MRVAITGGARGIGRATAEAFRRHGATVVLGDLDVALVKETASAIGAEGVELDVTDSASFETFLDAAGPIDVLVNNAGVMPTGRLLDETDAATDLMLGVNLRGVVVGTKLAARRFVERGSGRVINVASLAGRLPAPGLSTYGATKAAVISFGETLGRELAGTGVSVTTVLPGVVNTELSAGARVPAWLRQVVCVEPEQVAEAIRAAAGGHRSTVVVPRRFGATVRVLDVLPRRLRERFESSIDLHNVFVHSDPMLRARYHDRIFGGRR